MAIICANCGQENPDGFRLCGMCGTALTAERAPMREERKVVTVLFCDLVGSTARAEGLDPEDVRAVLSRFHAQVRAELERHGGTVEKFIGDAVMALFGAPIAHEDDPERAVRAALAIREFAQGEGTDLRIGVTTGEALVALGSRPAEGEGMASGDVVNTAARLQTAAPVNGILVDGATHRATRSNITYREAAAIEAKGKSTPIAVWEAVEARSRFGIDVSHHARARLVGREQELGVLRTALNRAREDRLPQLVTLVAVPGMGKSRLIYELSRIVDAEPDLTTWRQGRCLAYGEGVAYWALGEVVKAQAGILEQDGSEGAGAKLTASVTDVLEDAGERQWVERHLRPLVGLETSAGLGGDRRGEAFAAWRRYLEALAEQRPLVLVLEDLHWADDGLLDFVDELIDWLTDVPLLVMCSARPELLQRRPSWGGGKLNASTLALPPLSSEQTSTLLAEVLGSPRLAPDVARTLLERVDGNPLYAEQFAELMLERGVADELALPENLQGIVAARLDGLAPDEKAILQAASVLGKVFWAGAVGGGDRTDPLLQGLARKGFLTRQRRSSVEQESEWSFAHMLLRDVAYGQIPRGERSAKHRRAAEWIASLGRPEDHAELLAHHWGTALELAEAAGLDTAELVDPARRAFRAAGARSYAVNAFPTAVAFYDRALARWPADDPDRGSLVYERADALLMANDPRAVAALADARDVMIAGGDRDRAALAEHGLARLAWHRGSGAEARALDRRAAELAEGGSPATTAQVLASIARTATIGGDDAEGRRLATAVLDLLGEDGPLETRAHALATIGLARRYVGDASGIDDERRALAMAIEAHSPIAGAIANNVAVLVLQDLDIPETDRAFAEGLAIAERFGDVAGAAWLRNQRAGMAFFLGRWDEALAHIDGVLAEAEAGTETYHESTFLTHRAQIREARGDVAGSLDDRRRAIARGRRAMDPQELGPPLGGAAAAFETHGLIDEARTIAGEVIALSAANPVDGSWGIGPEFAFSRLALESADAIRPILDHPGLFGWAPPIRACIDGDFVRAAEIWAGAGSPTVEARARFRAAEVALENGRRGEAEEQMERALSFYREVGGTFWIERGEALLRGEVLGQS